MSLQLQGTTDYINVSRGTIPGASSVFISGYNPGVASGDTTVWNETTTLVAYPASAATVTVSSGSANDTSNGTGARTVSISGLDGSFNTITETVTLNGQTAVTTTNSFYRFNLLTVLTAGSGGVNAGVIYVGTGALTSGKPATIYDSIGVGFNTCQTAIYTVPANSTAYFLGGGFSSDQSATATPNNVTVKLLTRANGGLFLTQRLYVGDGVIVPSLLPASLPAGTDIQIRVNTPASTAIVTVEFELLLITSD